MASTITITCPECDKLLKVPSQAEGKKVRCSACDATFIAHAEEEDEIVVVEEEEDTRARPAKAKQGKVKAAPAKPAAKPAAPPKPNDGFTPDTVAFGLVDEYLGRRCPDCANAIGDEDRICLSCGYDTISRNRARTRKVQHTTGFDITFWLLPGIVCAIVCLAVLGGLAFLFIQVDKAFFGDVWYDFLGGIGTKVYAGALGLFIVYKTGRFAINRLIFHPKPPEIELKLESGRKS